MNCTRKDRSSDGGIPCAKVTNTKTGKLGYWLWCSNCLVTELNATKKDLAEARGLAISICAATDLPESWFDDEIPDWLRENSTENPS